MTASPVTEIDPENWSRTGQFSLFRTYGNPHFSITAPLDVTRLVRELKPAGVSVFNACVYALTLAGNHVAEFRTRFDDVRVYEHGSVGASFTIPLPNKGFAFCEVEPHENFDVFDKSCSAAIHAARQQEKLTETTRGQDGWLFMSCLPWLSFSAMHHAVRGPDDCVPRIAWGRYTGTDCGRMTLPVSVQVHHALVDGFHVGQYMQKAQNVLDELEATLEV